MDVREGMSTDVLSVSEDDTLEEAARRMVERGVGAAVVAGEGEGPGLITERSVLNAVGAGRPAAEERVADHMTAAPVYAEPDWSLEQAAQAMVDGGFRHLVVLEDGETAGVISMRDVLRSWAGE
jgi:CBS domain-containing protein